MVIVRVAHCAEGKGCMVTEARCALCHGTGLSGGHACCVLCRGMGVGLHSDRVALRVVPWHGVDWCGDRVGWIEW